MKTSQLKILILILLFFYLNDYFYENFHLTIYKLNILTIIFIIIFLFSIFYIRLSEIIKMYVTKLFI